MNEQMNKSFDSQARTWDDDPMKTSRAQAVAQAIEAQVPLAPHMTALEYGCGTGLLSFALQPRFSRITLALGERSLAALPRHLADYVVTEHGIAALRGLGVQARAAALIAIAAPDFREGLARQWAGVAQKL